MFFINFHARDPSAPSSLETRNPLSLSLSLRFSRSVPRAKIVKRRLQGYGGGGEINARRAAARMARKIKSRGLPCNILFCPVGGFEIRAIFDDD